MASFAVDFTRLDEAVNLLVARTATVEDQLAELDACIAALQQLWTGDAAEAQLDAHRRWLDGAHHMREGLAAMGRAAATAHENYAAAVAANQQMWQ